MMNYSSAINFYKRRIKEYRDVCIQLKPFIPKNCTIVDVGANIGFFSLSLLNEIPHSGPVLLFEPIPKLADYCQKTFRNTHFDVTVFDYGLGDKNGIRTIYTSIDGNIGWNTLIKKKISVGMEKMKIKIKRFDDLKIHNIGFIKIDTEGFEYSVINGMKKTVISQMPTFYVEVGWGKNSHPNWAEEKAAFKWLLNHGYGSYSLEREKINVFEIDRTMDVLFLKQ